MTSEERQRIKNEHLGHGLRDTTALSWLFCRNLIAPKIEKYEISAEEKTLLRSLAAEVAKYAEMPIQEERKKLWKDHLSLKQTRPLVFIDPELAWYEYIPHTSLTCKNDLAKIWEFRLRKEIFWQEKIGDDRVCTKTFTVPDVVTFSDFGLEQKRIGDGKGGAYQVEPSIRDYDTDLGKLRFRELYHDKERSAKLMELAHDVFDGILDVKRENSWWYSCGLTSDLIALRGFENFLYDIYDYPDELKSLMAFLRDDWLNMLDFLEKNDLLSLNNGGEFMGTGGYGWCDDLPAPGFDPGHVRPVDMWGYGESQESVSVSPEVFDEFVLPYQIPILEKFGLNAYGCCEPLDTRIDIIKAKVPRLRKVSVPQWSDTHLMAEKLRGDYVYCWKMNPAYIATENVDENEIRRVIRDTVTVTREYGCPTEMLMRDVQTLAYRVENAQIWTKIAMEEAKRSMG